jgi:zinc/manganese transport system permease protein
MFVQLLGEHFVHTALLAGAVVAVISGAIGTFVVTRGASFAVHAISELGFTGAAAALVLGFDVVVGMIVGSLAVGLVLGLLSLRGRERDSSIGAVLSFGLGVGVLLIFLYQGYATEATNLLFGSIVGVSDAQLRNLVIVAVIVGAGLVVLYRPLLFSSVDPDVAAARGVPLRALSVAIFLLLALTTAEAIQVVGVLLVLTLVITPAAAAQRLTVRPGLAILLSIAIALLATEGGILLSLAQPWPTSFFISSISFAAYLLARIVEATRDRRRSQPTGRRRRRNANTDTTRSETRPAPSAATSE